MGWQQLGSGDQRLAQAPPPLPVQTEAAAGGGPALRRISPMRVAAVLSLGFALFVSASIGLVIWRDPSNTSPQRAAGLPSAGGTDPIGHLDERTRKATIGPASLTMPDDPHTLAPPDGHRGVLDLLFWAAAPVHIRYDGKHDSVVLLGRVAEQSSAGDLQTDGKLALHRLSQAIFDHHPTELKRMTSEQRTVDGQPAMLFSAQAHYSVDQPPSRYDTVTALLVRLDDGSLIIAASSRQ